MSSEEQLLKVLLTPYVSEKATLVEEKRQYVFKVLPNATKEMVKKAVALMFNVDVLKVQICNVKGKVKKFAQRTGRRPNWRKAYVTLKEGQNIDFGDLGGGRK